MTRAILRRMGVGDDTSGARKFSRGLYLEAEAICQMFGDLVNHVSVCEAKCEAKDCGEKNHVYHYGGLADRTAAIHLRMTKLAEMVATMRDGAWSHMMQERLPKPELGPNLLEIIGGLRAAQAEKKDEVRSTSARHYPRAPDGC